MKNISIIGLGKLGSPMLATYASKGFNVIGADVSRIIIDCINKGRSPVKEEKVELLIKRNKNRIKTTSNMGKAVLSTDITFIIVPTPSDETGGFSIDYVLDSCQKIGKALSQKSDYHLVVLVSTVLPGASLDKIIPVLEKFSGKKCGKDFGYCYSPEFIALGSVVKDLLNPDLFLIGEYNKKSGEILEKFYRKISKNKKIIVERMSISSAELTKISLNSYVTMKITFANILGKICNKIPGADIDKVTQALGRDKRIGQYFLKAGLSYGGPCFPRDNQAFSYMANKLGVETPLAELTHACNIIFIDYVLDLILSNTKKGATIAIFGLAYKSDTPVVEESAALIIAQKLIEKGYNICIYDPLTYENVKPILDNKARYCRTIKECLENADVYFVSYPKKEFEIIAKFLSGKSGKTLIDPWRQFRKFKLEKIKGLKYVPLGIGK